MKASLACRAPTRASHGRGLARSAMCADRSAACHHSKRAKLEARAAMVCDLAQPTECRAAQVMDHAMTWVLCRVAVGTALTVHTKALRRRRPIRLAGARGSDWVVGSRWTVHGDWCRSLKLGVGDRFPPEISPNLARARSADQFISRIEPHPCEACDRPQVARPRCGLRDGSRAARRSSLATRSLQTPMMRRTGSKSRFPCRKGKLCEALYVFLL